MNNASAIAHFDGKYILLDQELDLAPNAKLLVTVLTRDETEREEWNNFSGKRLEDTYDPNEIEYSLDLIKEVNPEYDGGNASGDQLDQVFAELSQKYS